MLKSFTVAVFFLLLGFVFGVTAPSKTEMSITDRQATPGGVGICSPEFAEKKILPVATCFCHVLFTGEVTVNVQECVKSDCLCFFGSEETILELENACPKFRNADGTLKKKEIENKLNFIRQTCFPDKDFDVILN